MRLAKESGIETPTREQLAKLDRKRPKKGSNDEWTHPHDPDARITKMKDGRTHLAHQAEHAVDLETGAIVAVTLHGADVGDTATIPETVAEAGERITGVVASDTVSLQMGKHSLLLGAEVRLNLNLYDVGFYTRGLIQFLSFNDFLTGSTSVTLTSITCRTPRRLGQNRRSGSGRADHDGQNCVARTSGLQVGCIRAARGVVDLSIPVK
jgi:hypothetical protein